ncbi:MAG: hypothetical protein WBL61_22745 [Bryobacteraceae bacterium]
MKPDTPSKMQELQIKLYRKAKDEPGYRFYQLYDKVNREDILPRLRTGESQSSCAGVGWGKLRGDHSRGLAEWLKGLGKDLHDKTYQPVKAK